MRFYYTVFPGSSVVKNPPTMQAAQEKRARSLGWEDPLAQEMTTHYSIPAWRIPWTEEPGGLHGVAKSWTWLSDRTTTYYKKRPKNIEKISDIKNWFFEKKQN